jgi:GNAT superfamily N-acetyltransferase
MTDEQVEGMIKSLSESGNSTILVAEDNKYLVGYVMAIRGRVRRNKHSAYLVMGVIKNYTRKGIGTKLLTQLVDWAKKAGIKRLELTTMLHNETAFSLYKKKRI